MRAFCTRSAASQAHTTPRVTLEQLCHGDVDLFHQGPRFLLPEGKRVVAAEDDRVFAVDLEDEAQGLGVVHEGVNIELAELLARGAFVIDCNEVRARVKAVLAAAAGARERAASVGEAHSQRRQALKDALSSRSPSGRS